MISPVTALIATNLLTIAIAAALAFGFRWALDQAMFLGREARRWQSEASRFQSKAMSSSFALQVMTEREASRIARLRAAGDKGRVAQSARAAARRDQSTPPVSPKKGSPHAENSTNPQG